MDFETLFAKTPTRSGRVWPSRCSAIDERTTRHQGYGISGPRLCENTLFSVIRVIRFPAILRGI